MSHTQEVYIIPQGNEEKELLRKDQVFKFYKWTENFDLRKMTNIFCNWSFPISVSLNPTRSYQLPGVTKCFQGFAASYLISFSTWTNLFFLLTCCVIPENILEFY